MIEAASSLQLVSSCGFGKSTADSFLTGWWAVQITILSWIVLVHPDLSPARNCKMEKCSLHWNWPKNPITTLVPIDGILLEVHNRKERGRAWSLVATTSHIRTLNMLFYSKTWLARAIPYSFQVGLYNQTLLICPQLRSNAPLLLVIIVATTTHILALSLVLL
jgi:hypothetical protein